MDFKRTDDLCLTIFCQRRHNLLKMYTLAFMGKNIIQKTFSVGNNEASRKRSEFDTGKTPELDGRYSFPRSCIAVAEFRTGRFCTSEQHARLGTLPT